MKKSLINIIHQLPYIRGIFQENVILKNRLNENKRHSSYPNGHYYSPVINVDTIRSRQDVIWNTKRELVDISLQEEDQIKLFNELISNFNNIPFPESKSTDYRYYFKNDYYSYTDGIMLFLFLVHFQPNKVIEIGSGFSSALMLDTNDKFLKKKAKLTFIEPYPERLKSLFKDNKDEACTLLESNVQDVDIQLFEQLQEADILFVDSSHVCKTDSDLNHILFEILPKLNSGVIIHFHDIFYPFEYPKEWVLAGKNWNEIYILRAFLMNNSRYEIIFFNDFMHRNNKELFQKIPLSFKNTGGSLWIRKI